LLSLVSAAALGVACAKHDPAKEEAPATRASAEATGAATAEVAATATGDAKLAAAPPRIGGSITAIGDYFVEVVTHRTGLVQAIVTDSRGAELHADVRVGITASSRAGTRESIALAFSAPSARFTGQASAGVELKSAPLAVSLEVGGKKLEGRIELCIALEPPRFGGHMMSLGSLGAEVRISPNGEVHAALVDSSGAQVKAGLRLEASVRTLAGTDERIELAFDPALARFRGHAAASAKLAPGPLTLSLAAGGNVVVGGLARVALDTGELALRASAKAAAGAAVKPNAAAGAKVQVTAKAAALAPKINVQAPKVDVSVKKSAEAKTGGAKASAGFSFGAK
jgi:hypothetical protein